MKYYVTKYCLTDGIQEVEGGIPSSSNLVTVKCKDKIGYNQYFILNKEVFVNFGDACKKAKEMRKRKIKSLEKSLAKMKALKFQSEE